MTIIKSALNSQITYIILLGGTLATLLLDYAFGSISLILLLLISSLNLFFNKPKIIKSYYPLIILYLIMLASVIWSFDKEQSIRGLIKFAPLISIPLAFMFMPKLNSNSIKTIFTIFTYTNSLFGTILIVNAIWRFFNTMDSSVFFYHEFASILDLNAIYASSFFLLSLSFLIFKKKFNFLNLIIAIVLFINIVLLSSKLIIFLLFALLIAVFSKSKIRKERKKMAFLLTVVGIIIFLFTGNFFKRVQEEFDKGFIEVLYNNDFSMNFYPWSGASIRLFQGRVLYELMERDNFFFTGYGVNASQDKIIEIHKKYGLYKGFYHYNFHNQYLQILAEIGLLGLIFLLLALLLLFRSFLFSNDFFILSVFLLFSFLFLTESYLCTQKGIIHFTICYCLILYSSVNSKNSFSGIIKKLN